MSGDKRGLELDVRRQMSKGVPSPLTILDESRALRLGLLGKAILIFGLRELIQLGIKREKAGVQAQYGNQLLTDAG